MGVVLYNFSRFTKGISEDESKNKGKNKKEKFDPSKISFSSNSEGEIDPIKNNNTDSSYLFNNDDAIVFDLKNNNN